MKSKQNLQILIAEIQDELSKLKQLGQKLTKQKDVVNSEENLESAALRLHN